MRSRPFAAVLMILVACGGDDAAVLDGGGDAAVTSDAPAGCMRTAASPDRPRFVVISHPYNAAGDSSPMFEVLDLSTTGALTRPQPPRTFSLAKRASFGTVEFTPDGEVGIVALEDGHLGVFQLDAAGTPTVVQASFAGSFYADQIVMDPRGDRAWIVDGNTRENGGGIYLVTIACDGSVSDRGLVAAANLPGGLAFTVDGRALVAARNILDVTTPGLDAHLLRWSDPPSVIGGVDAFGDDEAIVGGSALTSDGKTFLIGDKSAFASVPNRVAVVGVGPTALTRSTVLTPIEDPDSIATSPFGDIALVTSAIGDAIFVLDTGGTAGAWRVRGEVNYVQGSPMLPGDIAMVSRGMLNGHVFVSENVSIRHLAFRASGEVEDLGSLQLGSGLQNISGVIGVTP